MLDDLVPYRSGRWGFCVCMLLVYIIRIYFIQVSVIRALILYKFSPSPPLGLVHSDICISYLFT